MAPSSLPARSITAEVFDTSAGRRVFLGNAHFHGLDCEDAYSEWCCGVLDGNFGRDAWTLEDGDRGCVLILDENNRVVGHIVETVEPFPVERAAPAVLARAA